MCVYTPNKMKIIFDEKNCDLNKEDQVATKKLIKLLSKEFETKNLITLFTNKTITGSEGVELDGIHIKTKISINNYILYSIIKVNTSKTRWMRTFFHELGHHIDKRKNTSIKGSEAFAEEFADILYKKYTNKLGEQKC